MPPWQQQKKLKQNLKLKRRLQDTEGTIYTAYMLT